VVRLDPEATSISLLVVIGTRAHGQKMLPTFKSMGGGKPRPILIAQSETV
jgi:hypothetical protein